MISVEEAQARLFALVPVMETESVPLRQAAGRVLAHPATARLTQPPFAASAMDGYAVAEAPIPGATLRVVGEAAAGRAHPGTLAPGQTIRIFTGAPVPPGATRVILQEDVTRDGDAITLVGPFDTATHIRPAGQDFAEGQTLDAPRRLHPHDLALLAAMNVPQVSVSRRPVVALIASGDELVMPGEDPGPDQIVASNTFAIAALAEQAGAEVRMLPIARDTEASLVTTFGLAGGADLIVTVGGASVGDHDLVGRVAESLGLERAFWKIAMRPGKPLMAGRMQGALLLGLPGNPVSAIVCAHLFLLPVLAAMQGLPAQAPRALRARLAVDTGPAGNRDHYMRATLAPGDDLPLITPFANQDSALLSVLTGAQALLIRPKDDPARAAGEVVPYLQL